MKKQKLFLNAVLCLLSLSVFSVYVPEEYEGIAESTPPKQIDWVKRSKAGSKGNVTVYVDKDGVPTEVYVIGRSDVPTTMTAIEAEDFAQEEAEFNAKAAFAIWMKENVVVVNKNDRKRVVIRTNGTESSVTDNKYERKAQQIADGMWRGMSVYAHQLVNQQYISVWRWSVKEQHLAKIVEILTRDGNAVEPNRNVEEIPFTFLR